MYRIKKNDQVTVIAGKDKGKTGKVLAVFPRRNRALVEGINTVKKAQRRTQESQQGGFIEIEAPIHLSNIMLSDKKGNKTTRIGAQIDKSGSKKRVARRSGEAV